MGLRYGEIVRRRRDLALPGYDTMADTGLDGDWVTPYHLASASPTGPVLLTYNYLDGPSARRHRDELVTHGLLAQMPFNRVLSLALAQAGMSHADIYVTHSFHLLPPTRSAAVPSRDIDISFDAVARHELEGRTVIALGTAAASACRRHGIPAIATAHPSARGMSFAARAAELARALSQAMMVSR